MKGTATPVTRRTVVQGLVGAGLAAALPAPAVVGAARPRVAVIGAGAGGAGVVRQLIRLAPGRFDITLVDAATRYFPPYALHAVDRGSGCAVTPIEIAAALRDPGVSVAAGEVAALDAAGGELRLDGGERIAFDHCVAAPGVAFSSDWFAGAAPSPLWGSDATCEDVIELFRRVPDGGRLAFVAPAGPHRCPPSVYERACLASRWFAEHNPTASVLIVDDKDQYPMQTLFEAAYTDYYDDRIEWVPADFHGGVMRVDPEEGAIEAAADSFTADVINAVPPQTAPEVLRAAGLADDTGYCPVDAATMRSAIAENVLVVGDSAAAGDMSKSASAAVVQAELAAIALVATLDDAPVIAMPDLADRCWTMLAPDDAVALAGEYRATDHGFAATGRSVSQVEDDAETRRANAQAARDWLRGMLAGLYGAG